MDIQQVLAALETFAPLPLQEGFDNAGLQIGLTGEQDVTGALLCLDVTLDVVDEAIRNGFNLIVSHHPLLFHGLKRISNDGSSIERIVIKAIQNNVAIVSMHTNLDNAVGGVNYKMAQKLGLTDVSFLQPFTRAGLEGGSGVVGLLPEAMTDSEFVDSVKTVFNAPAAMCSQSCGRSVRKVALCGGAGSFLLGEAKAKGADVFITGEMHYHEYFEALGDIQIVVLGHYETEQYTSELLQEILAKSCPGLKTKIAQSTNPIYIV